MALSVNSFTDSRPYVPMRVTWIFRRLVGFFYKLQRLCFHLTGWPKSGVTSSSYFERLSTLTANLIVPAALDNIFQSNPFLYYLRDKRRGIKEAACKISRKGPKVNRRVRKARSNRSKRKRPRNH